eukprot:TRINITY_DN4927_c0_g2_i2.p1 TRINITY_DN4927_c0_g2~~TRINITY_DN4927_c0_g2_i2.p1  ORF type:complete len:486 (+),score=113.48 TRINITY_DN4927_c0_g2_i2:56-1513(+)
MGQHDDGADVTKFTTRVFKTLQETKDKWIGVYAQKLKDSPYETEETLKKRFTTYQGWKDFCTENHLGDAFMDAAAKVLGLHVQGTTLSARKTVEGYVDMTPAAVAPGVLSKARVGRVAFDVGVRNAVHEAAKPEDASMRATRALVLMSPPGAGKTYAAYTARSGQQKLEQADGELAYELVTAYVGFDRDLPLQPREERWLKEEGTTSLSVEERKERINEMLARRLLAVVLGLVKAAEGDLKRLDTANDVQRCTLPLDFWCGFVESEHFAISEEQALAELKNQLVRLKALSPEKMVVLLVVVDEAHLLDKIVPPIPAEGTGGAHFALRYLRSLQRDMRRTGVMILPMAVGLNADVSLGQATEGTNIVLRAEGEVMLKREEFRDFAIGLLNKHEVGKPEWHDIFQALFYPQVHKLLETYENAENTMRNLWTQSSECDIRNVAHAMQLLEASANGAYVVNEDIPIPSCAVVTIKAVHVWRWTTTTTCS